LDEVPGHVSRGAGRGFIQAVKMRNYLKKLVGTAGLEPATLAPKISAITY